MSQNQSASPRRESGLTSLLSRLSGASGRARSLTTSDYPGPTANRQSSASGSQSDAKERLQSILNSSKHLQQLPPSPKKVVQSRVISGPLQYQEDDDVGPYGPTAPSVYINALESTTNVENRVQQLKGLADSIRIFDSADPLQIWFKTEHFLTSAQPVPMRLAALRLLRACVLASNDSGMTSAAKLVFYSAICSYELDLKDCSDSEIGSLTAALEALCRGGRDVSGIDGLIERVCDLAGEMFKRNQAARDTLKGDFFRAHPEASLVANKLEIFTTPPLQDPTFASVCVAYPSAKRLSERHSATSSISLLTNIHKFSWPHLSADGIAFATRYLVAEGLATSNDRVIWMILDHFDVMSKFGFVPPEQLESVIYFVARVVSLEGRGRTLMVEDTEEPHLEQLNADLTIKARLVIRNLLRSSANQALKQLRKGTEPPSQSANDGRDLQVVVGCLRCIRYALNEVRQSPANLYTDGLPSNLTSASIDSWPIILAFGLPILFGNLQDALEWSAPDVLEEVLGIVLDSVSFQLEGTISEARPVIGFDEWDGVLDILERALQHVRLFEEDACTIWTLDLTDDFQKDKEEDATVPAYFQTMRQILLLLFQSHQAGSYNGPLDRYLSLLFALEPNMSDGSAVLLLDIYQRENVCVPTNSDWLQDLLEIVQAFLILQISDSIRPERSIEVLTEAHRLTRRNATFRALLLVSDIYDSVGDFESHRHSLLEQIILPVVDRMVGSGLPDSQANALLDLILRIARDCCEGLLETLEYAQRELDIMTNLFDLLVSASIVTVRHSRIDSTHSNASSAWSISTAIELFSVVFSSNSHLSAEFSKRCFVKLIHLLSPESTESPPAIVRYKILQLFLRFRADAKYRITIVRDVDIGGMISSLVRFNGESVLSSSQQLSLLAREENSTPERKRGRKARDSPDRNGEGVQSRSMSRLRPDTSRERKPRPVDVGPPLWSFPENLQFFKSEIVQGGRYVVSYDHNVVFEEAEGLSSATSADGPDTDNFPKYSAALDARVGSAPVLLPISEYLNMLILIIATDSDWDLVAYVLCHLPLQLSNKHLLAGPRSSRHIQRLEQFLCEGLNKGVLANATFLPPRCRREELPRLAYQTLATLIAYKNLFDKSRQDAMVETFANGLIQSETAKPCIHALAMACHELQPSMRKHLSHILANLLKIMSSSNMPVHILELIASIGQIKELFSSFRTEDYQTVFGISLQYIGLHNDREASSLTSDSLIKKDELASAFSQYVFHLAYYVIDLWYMSLKLSQRRQHVPFIVRKLIQANEMRGELDEPSEVCLDMVARYALANVDARPRKSRLQELVENQGTASVDIQTRTWIHGHALVSLRSLESNRWAELFVRRPSGSLQLLIEIQNDSRSDSTARDTEVLMALQRHKDAAKIDIDPAMSDKLSLDQVASRFGINISGSSLPEKLSNSITPSIETDSSFFAVQFSSFPDFGPSGPPLLVPDDEKYQRSIKLLDNIPVVDFHKVAVLYVSPDDHNEVDIFANTHGSRDYMQFLAGIGRLVRLKGNSSYYLGGLDKENDIDGKWAYIWDNNVTQIVYHVATLMPTDLKRDAQCTLKKRHIGNDFVKVVFNDSGRPFLQDTIPGQFNFVNIIIEPQTPAGKSWFARGMSSNTTFFKVLMQRRKGMPEIGPLGVFKMVSANSLPDLVRHLALHANVFAQVYLETVGLQGEKVAQKTEFVSNWRRRLQQIKQLRSRITPDEPKSLHRHLNADDVLKSLDFSKWA